MWYQNIGSIVYSFLTKHSYDGRTDRQNYDPQDRAIIAASRGIDRQVGSQVDSQGGSL